MISIQKVEKIILGLILGAVPVIGSFLAGWWISLPLVPESRIAVFALAGFLLGILVDLIFLRRWIRDAFGYKTWIWMSIYIFYSIGMFGFFMGVPVFHVLLALPAGFFVGCKLARNYEDLHHMKKAARKAAVFTTTIMGFICVASATFALLSPSTPSDVKGILGLPFQVTHTMIFGIILVGGTTIMALNWWLTLRAIERTYQYYLTQDSVPGQALT